MDQFDLDTNILIIRRLKEIAHCIERDPLTFTESVRYGYYVMALELFKLGIIEYDLYKQFLRVVYPRDWFYLIGLAYPQELSV